jgi:RND family efflux transporter MFP subunit
MANRAQLETLDAELSVKQTQVETLIRATEEESAFAEKALDRMKTLAATGTAAARALYEAQLVVDLATIRRKGALKQLKPYTDARNRLSGLLTPAPADSTGIERTNLRVPLVSPVHGTLVEAHATAGQFLNQGDQVFQIIDMQTVWIEARVSEYDLAKVEQAPGASYRLSAYPDELRPILGSGGGRLVDVGVVVDPANRTLPVRYEVPNREHRLRIGMFAEVLVETHRREQALAVPSEALIDDSGESTVYVQHSGETFEKRPVKTGIRDGDWVEIVEGLSPGERVVAQGAFALRLASMSSAMPAHGHEH